MHESFVNLRGKLALRCTITVEFLPGIVDLECYAEAGMQARIVSCRFMDHGGEGDVIRIGFDFRPFDARNAALESANYYGTDGVPNLTARESGFYDPTSAEEHIYFDADQGFSEYFNVLRVENVSESEPDYKQALYETLAILQNGLTSIPAADNECTSEAIERIERALK